MARYFATVVASAVLCASGAAIADDAIPRRPVNTYSIVARDAATGELGVAVQSHWFSVGPSVAWAEPGVGAVATQSFTDPRYGPLGLAMMRAGKTAEQALAGVLASDTATPVRQVAMIDAEGNVSAHTGEDAIVHACDIQGDGYSVQANLMEKDTVCAAMSAAFEAAEGDLAERMMAALEAAQGEGGDIRGMQSAALLVVGGDRGEPAWGGRVFDLRVEDAPEPLAELRRLLTLARAYNLMQAGDDLVTEGKMDEAMEAYRAASELAPDNHEMVFWTAATLAATGDVEASLPYFKTAFDAHPPWRDLVRRLPASGLLPDDEALIERILAVD